MGLVIIWVKGYRRMTCLCLTQVKLREFQRESPDEPTTGQPLDG
jgi:hypothetical protein